MIIEKVLSIATSYVYIYRKYCVQNVGETDRVGIEDRGWIFMLGFHEP